jgi:hypothetical protein
MSSKSLGANEKNETSAAAIIADPINKIPMIDNAIKDCAPNP